MSSASRFPFSTACALSLMRAVVLSAASALFPARLRTSSATTAKPFPASPALAASMEALSARIFVWNAISPMVPFISCIFSDVLRIWAMALRSSFIWALPCSAMHEVLPDNSRALSVSFTLSLIILSVEATSPDISSTREVCFEALSARLAAPCETFPAPEYTTAAASLISENTPPSSEMM